MSDPLSCVLAVIALIVFFLGVQYSKPWLRERYQDWQKKRLKRQLRRELDRLQRVCITNYEGLAATDIAQILTWRDQIDAWDPPVLPAQPKEEVSFDLRNDPYWTYLPPGQRMSVRDMLEIPPVVPHFSGYDQPTEEESPWWIQEHKRLLREIDEILEREQF